jgi:hypothetical protein
VPEKLIRNGSPNHTGTLIFTLGNAHAQQSNDFGNELTDIITRLQKRYPDQG